ncbi:Aspartic proteinase MKC7 [Wickerhamomyces ciferrii]|uniref:Aspartic proteinase MKC7 n=1 Tax=Wickerhamomyces ciferrii (strain ATCC 14091 / BCRC 22168 / CBS 111 / JCM 3599 / NBRC 0793 / NRRL Y-1031 F-60-10) TaxID=1206466 RepID=K0KF23_WICCF|nr:Aspartic proteinase MKC7 [Wickerhamomyces ciferrii]CCH40807.1 Aspartic proteinase MKC7 [Wickerhamomyces ciferrii]
MKLLSLLSLGFLASNVIAKNIAGVQGFNFDISRGDDYLSSHKDKRTRFVKRDSPDGTIQTTLENEKSFYSVSLLIGDHTENVTVLIDTGSSDLWVTGSNNPYCSSGGSSSSSSGSSNSNKFRSLDFLNENVNVTLGHRRPIAQKDIGEGGNGGGGSPFQTQSASASNLASQTQVDSSQATIDCSEYGTFDVESSSTFKSNNTEFYIVYGDGSFAYGTWGHDDVTVGGTKVSSLSFAVANETNSTVGVLGIGLEGLETTSSGSSASSGNSYTYPNFPSKLVQDGLINKRVYSLFLDSSDADSGTILFGGVDHSKYSGTLITVPLINTLESRGFSEILKLEITLSGIGLENDDNQETITTTQIPALLDSGTTLTYMPSSVISQIASKLNADYSRTSGYYITKCYGSNDGYIVYDFQGKLIRVPLQDIVLQTSSSSSQCVLGLFDSGDDSIILGDSFLRSAYVVYNLDDLEISLAQAEYTDDSDIEVVSDSVPSASRAAAYSSSWSSQASLSTGGDIFTNSDDSQIASSGSSGGSPRSSRSSGSNSRSTSTSSSGSSSSGSSSSSNSDKSSDASILMNSLWSFVSVSMVLTFGLICL